MKRYTIKELVEKYEEKLQENSKLKNVVIQLENTEKIFKDFNEQIRGIDDNDYEKEIIGYFENITENNGFDEKTHWWISSVLEHPYAKFIPYLIEMLKMESEKIPYYSIVDVLTYMPPETAELAVEGLCEAILKNNPYWHWSIFQSAFQAIIWNGNEESEKFVYECCNSEVEFISEWARYYRDNWIKDPEEDEC